MELGKLHEGLLIRRYKRFLADIETDGGVITAHCPNTGAMTGCAERGSRVWFSLSDNPRRKYAATWELVDTGSGFASVNTLRANALVKEAIEAGRITALDCDVPLRAEAPIPGGGGRFDFQLQTQPATFVEVKSVTLRQSRGVGMFPDAVSSRGQKHLRALMARAEAGDRAVLLFCAQHTGVGMVTPAASIDPHYANLLDEALSAGVEVLAYGCELIWREHMPVEFVIGKSLPFDSQRGELSGSVV